MARFVFALLSLPFSFCFFCIPQEKEFSPEELEALQLKIYTEDRKSFGKWTKRLSRWYKRGDTNKDGTVDVLELRRLIDREMKDTETSENDLVLKTMRKTNPRFDINRDGVLTKQEALQYIDWYILMDRKYGGPSK